MIKIEDVRGTGKTTKLLRLSHQYGYIVVEPTMKAAENALRIAIHNDLSNTRVIPVYTFLRENLTFKDEKFLFDQLDTCLNGMNVVGYTETEYPNLGCYSL